MPQQNPKSDRLLAGRTNRAPLRSSDSARLNLRLLAADRGGAQGMESENLKSLNRMVGTLCSLSIQLPRGHKIVPTLPGCPWMAMNGLENLAAVLENGLNEIQIDPAIGRRAKISIERMLKFARQINLPTHGIGNA